MKYVKADLQKLANTGKTMEQVGHIFGVSRQRMYQIYNALGISTPERRRKSQLNGWDDRQKWFWNTLCHVTPQRWNRVEKLSLLESTELPEHCPILGIPLDYSFGKGTRSDNSPSLDESLVVISWRANKVNNEGSWEEHQKIADFYRVRSASGAQNQQ